MLDSLPTAAYLDALERIGRSVKRLRQRRRWSQNVVAGFAGLHVRHYQKIESGRQNVSVDTLVKIGIGLRLADWTEILEPPGHRSPVSDGLPITLSLNALDRIAVNMSRLRRRRRWTQQRAARFAGIGAHYWQTLEGGQENVSVAILVKVASGLGLDDWTDLLREPPYQHLGGP